MTTKQIWDPVNRVWCSAIPAGWTFTEWREAEDEMAREMIARSPMFQTTVMRLAMRALSGSRCGHTDLPGGFVADVSRT